MDCLLPAAFLALSGGPAAHVGMEGPPFDPGLAPPPPAAGKATYGGDLPYQVDSANFTVQWSDPTVSASRAGQISAQLEAAWVHLVEEQGWAPPVSADRYRLWVLLDPALGGSGYTTEYVSEDYPEGYPVMWVNPVFEEEDIPAFALSVAVHEFGHALQLRHRDWGVGDEEIWFWEASAEWIAERGAPELDTYALSSYWYAFAPTVAYSTYAGGHAYGMFLVAAWLEEHGGGELRSVWAEQEGRGWEEVLAEAAGRPFSEVIVETSGAYAASALRESSLYYLPEMPSLVGPEALRTDTPGGRLGTWYYAVDPGPEGVFFAQGDVQVRYAGDGEWGAVAPDGSFVAAVTTLEADGTFSVGLEARSEPVADPAPPSCGCSSGAARGAGGGAAGGALLVLLARRRGSRSRRG